MQSTHRPLSRRIVSAALVACLAVLCLAALCFTTPTVADAGEGWWGALDEGEAVSLRNVIRAPREYRGRVITFFCVFYTASGEYKYYPPNTAFTESQFLNFAVWPDGAPVWEEKTYIGNFPFFYLRRTNAQRNELVRTKRYTRLECTGRIRDIVRGRPAIEVFSFRETGHRLGDGVVRSIQAGLNRARLGTRDGYQIAARRFKEALQPDLAPAYALIVRKHLGDTLRQLGLEDEAARYERGETLGVAPLPRPDPAAAFADGTYPDLGPPPTGPSGFPEAGPQPPARGGLPAGHLPAGNGSPDGGPLPAGHLPAGNGSPDGGPLAAGSGSPDGARPRARLPEAPGGLPQPPPDNPFASNDLPGRPMDAGPAPAPRRSRAPDRRTAHPTPAKPASGIPPKRRPRLSGVK